jgi:hypothetical protein
MASGTGAGRVGVPEVVWTSGWAGLRSARMATRRSSGAGEGWVEVPEVVWTSGWAGLRSARVRA